MMKIIYLTLCILIISGSASLEAQNIRVLRSVVGGGGALNEPNDKKILISGTVSQIAIGKIVVTDGSSTNQLYLGFWTPIFDFNSTVEEYSPISENYLDIYPNPFSSVTHINYELKGFAKTHIRIFDISGRIVKELEPKEQSAGLYDIIWDGKDSAGKTLPAGTYYCELKVSPSVDKAYSLKSIMVLSK